MRPNKSQLNVGLIKKQTIKKILNIYHQYGITYTIYNSILYIVKQLSTVLPLRCVYYPPLSNYRMRRVQRWAVGILTIKVGAVVVGILGNNIGGWDWCCSQQPCARTETTSDRRRDNETKWSTLVSEFAARWRTFSCFVQEYIIVI